MTRTAPLCIVAIAGLGLLPALSGCGDSADQTETGTRPTTTVQSTDGSAQAEPQEEAVAFPRPEIVWDPIPFGSERKAEMAAYSERHYGDSEWRLSDPRAIVLHYTAGGDYAGVHSTFAADVANRGELPGVCAHFVVDQDGTIYQLVPLDVRCRHAIGINDRAIGIEMVQDATADPRDAARMILDRREQSQAAVKLVAWLTDRFGIPTSDVIGHGMVNDSRYFRDLSGWTNDHVDWLPPEVSEFRERVDKVLERASTRGP